MPHMGDQFTDRERLALAHGDAYVYAGRVIPIVRGADGEGDSGGDGGGEGDGGGGGPAAAADAKTYTQDEVETLVKDRLKSVHKKYEGFDDLKTKAAKLDELEAANATELEKAQKRAEEAEKERDSVRAESRASTLRASLIAEAAKADRKIVDPQAAADFLTGTDADLLELDKDGNPNDIANAVDSLLEKRPYLVAADGGARPGGADQGARGGGDKQITADELKSMSPDEINKARREGRVDSLLGVSK